MSNLQHSYRPICTISDLLSGRRPRLEGVSGVGLVDYAGEIVRSGFPAMRTLSPRLDAAVITTGSGAYRRADGIGVIPAALLTA